MTGANRNIAVKTLSLLLWFVTCSTFGTARAAPPKSVRAHPRGDTPIVIDGVLDESPWRQAPVATGFVEREPYPGRPAGAATTFSVLYDADHLYIGVVSHLDPEEVPRALELSRDNFDIFADDVISLKFDARLDARNTVGLAANPAGAQLDYVVVDNGGSFRREFDANWIVATTVEADRWTAEFEIPIAALGLTGDVGERSIGLNVTRDHNRRLATYDWNPMAPEFGPTNANFYGRVDGLVDVAGGRTLTLIPYGLAGFSRGPGVAGAVDFDRDLELKIGGDIRMRVTDDVWAELTVLTDFAQVDLDDPVLNLDRFPLFFPERRPFFLTGLDVFEFGVSGFVSPFFTRRIGLDEARNVVPLLGGLKVYGSSGDLRFGLLEVVTGEADDASAENFTIARTRYNFGERGYVGVIGTFDGEISNRPNATMNPVDPGFSFGADGAYVAFDKRLALTAFWTGTMNTVEGERIDGQAWRTALAWRGERVQPSVAVTYVSEAYDPLVGFVARRDLVQSRFDLAWVTRPVDSPFRNIIVGATAMLEHDAALSNLIGQNANAYVTTSLASGVRITADATAKEDFVRRPFENQAGVTVAAGRYQGPKASIEIVSPEARNPSGSLRYAYDGALFGGERHDLGASAAIRLGPHFNARASATYTVFEFPGTEAQQTVVGSGTFRIVPSTRFSIDLIGQVNGLAERAAGLLRLRWRYLPGSELFFIYRENVDFSKDGQEDGRFVALKLTFRYDAVL